MLPNPPPRSTYRGATVNHVLADLGEERPYHDLKILESRFDSTSETGSSLTYYCVCGKWKGKVDHLRQAEIMNLFITEHLT